ncbi:MAG: RNA-binding cell elongation regulator Jag/EloR [Limosilactobacillus sp.]
MVVYTGKTVAQAVQAASQALHQPREKLEIAVLEQPRRGFLGIGSRPAKITAIVKTAGKQSAAPKTAGTAAASAQPISPAAPIKQPAASTSSSQPAPATETASPASAKSIAATTGDDLDPAVIAARHAANLKKVRTTGKQLVEYLQAVFRTLGIGTVPTITAIEAHAITIDIKTPEPGRVIGRHGQRINALEQLSNVFMNYHGAPKTVVMLDTADYRQRRQQVLHELAQRAETEVVASGQAVFLDPMPARERKQLHKELEDNPHVKTYSHGREPYRSVVVAPKN